MKTKKEIRNIAVAQIEEKEIIKQLASDEIDCTFRALLEFCIYGQYDYIRIYSEKMNGILRAFQICKIFSEEEIAFLFRCVNSIFNLNDYTNVGRFL